MTLITAMSQQTEILLAELLEVQRRMLVAQEAVVANQRELLERQRRVLRQTVPLFAVLLLVIVGPYLWNLIAYVVNR